MTPTLRWLGSLQWPWKRPADPDAARARLSSRNRRQKATKDWPRVHDARDAFTAMVEDSMRRRNEGSR